MFRGSIKICLLLDLFYVTLASILKWLLSSDVVFCSCGR